MTLDPVLHGLVAAMTDLRTRHPENDSECLLVNHCRWKGAKPWPVALIMNLALALTRKASA